MSSTTALPLEATVDATALEEYLTALDAIVDEATIESRAGEMRTKTVDPANVALAEASLAPDAFEDEPALTDGGRLECPDCGHELDTEENNDALAADEYHDYFCPRCGRLFEDEPALTDGGEVPLPTEDVPTPTLDTWTHSAGGWDTWTAPTEVYRVHVEMVDLEVPPDELWYAFEVRLDDCREGRPFETVVRETIRNSALALIVADELAQSAQSFAEDWEEGLAPRPEEVEHVGE